MLEALNRRLGLVLKEWKKDKIQLIIGHIHPLHMGLAQMVIMAVKVITNIQAWSLEHN